MSGDNGGAPRHSSRRMTWYSLVALVLVAVLVFNREREAVDLYEKEESTALDEAAAAATASAAAPKKPRPRRIKQISILGERNSGTRWTFGHLGECFNHTLTVKRDLTRYKHWFQYPNATKYRHDTLVVAQFRNPYDWLEAMRNVPHHSPRHMFLHWSEFLTKPWTMERQGTDIGLANDTWCHEDFRWNQIISCADEPIPREQIDHKLRYSENKPFYELKQDGSGEPWANIMEMRAAKIRNFLEVKDYVGVADVWTVQYEYLLSTGTKKMLDMISEWTGVAYKCEPYPPQNRRKRKLSARYAKYVNEHLDWSAEGLIGYKQSEINTTEGK